MRIAVCFFLLLATLPLQAAEDSDTARHIGYTVYAVPQWQIAMDEYERQWLREKRAFAFGAELNYSALPSDSDAFAIDYNYPTLSIGAKLALNNGVTMRREGSWGKAELVDYDSKLGDIFTLYGAFTRPLLRSRHWQVDYLLRAGVGYGPFIYNKTDNIDNELIGSVFNIYFGAGIQASYSLTDDWALTAALLYGHHSNGAMARPNKGENHLGPMIGVKYMPYHKAVCEAAKTQSPAFQKYWYADIRLGIGGKTLLEDWHRTQYNTNPGEPDYRTEDFKFYMAYSLQTNVMYRYANRWASGIGADLFYGTYYKHVRELDEAAGHDVKHSPWSVGIAAKHEVYYHNLSLDMALGFYLYRHMGVNAKEIEQPYYERIGVFYTFPTLGNLKVGASVQAHRTKADLTEMVISIPLRFKTKVK